MAGPAVFFVPLAIAGGKVFFKFATKKAAQAFKGRFAKAGSVTTRTPPKSATVTTTGSNKGKAIIKDMTKPVTQARISPRNPNTSTLPKAPAKGSGGAKAAGVAATAAGVAAGSTATGKDADKPKSTKSNRATSQGGRSRAQVIEQRQEALARKGGASLSRIKKKRAATGTYDRGAVETSKPKGKPMTMPTTLAASFNLSSPPKRPKKKMETPKPKPKMYTAINVNTGKPDFDAPKVTAAQRLKQEDKFKAKKKALDLVKSAAKKSINKKGKK